jgi:DNA-binding CsgD family transcriptional regulator
MKPAIYPEAGKIWKNLHKDIDEQKLELDIERHKKMLDIFHINKYYYFVFNIRKGDFDFVSDEVTELLGYQKQEYNVPFLLQNIHAEDQPWFLNFENKVVEFFSKLTLEQIPNYKVSYDYRIRKKDGEFVRILQQVITISYDEDGRLLRTLGVHTDISHIKQYGKPSLSFIGINGEPSYYNVDVKDVFKASTVQITQREREVLCLVVNGKSSGDIATLLHISKQTVDTHRKNLLNKTETANTAELISKAIRSGWV